VTAGSGGTDTPVILPREIRLAQRPILVGQASGRRNRDSADGESMSTALLSFGRRVPISESEIGLFDPSCLYRAHVRPCDCHQPVRTAFVEAPCKIEAVLKISGVMAVLEGRSLAEVQKRVYEVKSAHQCIAEGKSADRQLRLFETACSRTGVSAFVRHPVFLLDDPASLTRKWSQIPAWVAP
jgi:hypothetical protein